MNSGLSVNLTSYRLLLHDLDPKNVPFHHPDPEAFTATPEQTEKVKNIISEKLRTFSPLTSTDPEFALITEFLIAYGYNYNDIKDNLTIERIPNTDYIDVKVSSDNASLSALAANAFCEEFIRYNKSLKLERSSESVEFLAQVT